MSKLHNTIYLLVLLVLCCSAQALAQDCNGNAIDDPCDIDCGVPTGPCDVPGCGLIPDCNGNGIPDDCEADCDSNGIPDECDLAMAAGQCRWDHTIYDNTTGADPAFFLGPPDDNSYGIGGQIVTYEYNCGLIIDGPGPDFTIFELDSGVAEFDKMSVWVSVDGIWFIDISSHAEFPAVLIPGGTHGNSNFARSYDLGVIGHSYARYVQIDGDGTGAAGPTTGFDLDGLGVINYMDRDCDDSGVLDACEPFGDCNSDGIPDSCWLDENMDPDCNSNGNIDECDVLSLASLDCDSDLIPDECESDCNGNSVADDCDIDGGFSDDCNMNSVPDSCDFAVGQVYAASDQLAPLGSGWPVYFTIPSAFTAGSFVTVTVHATGDFDAANEYIDVTLNGTGVGRVHDTESTHCSSTIDSLVIPGDTFNDLVQGGDAEFWFVASSYASTVECIEPTITVTVEYDPIIDCNSNSTLDFCDIDTGTSTDLNLNGIPDDCEPDCNSNSIPDDYDLEQGISEDCNTNEFPDECDVGSGSSLDCNTNLIPDECEDDCNANGIPDDCDIAAATSYDCDINGIPDECDLTIGATVCPFTHKIHANMTGADDSIFLGPPDDVAYGIGGQVVSYIFDCGLIIDGPGPDFTIYEVDTGTAEFDKITLTVSDDGISFIDISHAQFPAVNIPGDETHGSNGYARSYDLRVTEFDYVRYIYIHGDGTGPAGATAGFDLDGLGAINYIARDCNSSGILDACELLDDCNSDGIPDSCYLAAGLDRDCNNNGYIDECDTLWISPDCNSNLVPDECEPDCNGNIIADDCDLASGFSDDCNVNSIPDSCDLVLATYSYDSGPISPVASGWPGSLVIYNAFPAGSIVTLTFTAVGDFDATNEYIDVDLNGTIVGRIYDTATTHCSPALDSLTIPAETYNDLVQGGNAVFQFITSSYASPIECLEPTITVTLEYDPILDCNTNATLDYCDIDTGTSTDLNLNGIADDCEPDCNTNSAPDDYDIAQGTSADCNTNENPDECDVGTGSSLDCNTNIIPDECEIDCNTNGIPDDCDIAVMTSLDCDSNAIPDECDMSIGADGCPFPDIVFDDTTGAEDWHYLGAPDDEFYGLGGQIVTLQFGCGFVIDGTGSDLTVYEADSGTVEFNDLGDILVSENGNDYFSIKSTETTAVNIPGDDLHGSNSFARSYDLAGSGVPVARFVRLDGVGAGSGGPSADFDLDAIGAINRMGRDCDASGTLDLCEPLGDCDGNLLPDSCEYYLDRDCNSNGVLDECDIAGPTSTDINANGTPDECEPDCNTNSIPDDHDIAVGTSTDCNHNTIPDECDLSSGTSLDCNADNFPDECPDCDAVEVVFVMDISTSMNDEGAALCSDIVQIEADLDADLGEMHSELLAIPFPGTGIYSCLAESVVDLYGTTVPDSPPPGNEILGDCPGGNEVISEDWGRATSVVAGEKTWIGDSVRLIVPLSDEGPWCGDPVTDPGVDRDSILHAIGVAQNNEVIVSPVTCSGSSSSMISLAQQLADSTGGQRFASTLPAEDLAEGLKAVIYDACDSQNDCNHNDIPDECEIAAGTLQDCDGFGVPDICEEDCNGNGYRDDCDIDWGTSNDLNLNTVPDECEVIELTLDAADLNWSAVDGAVGYDVIRGSLALLRLGDGDFSTAVDFCAVNDHPTTTTVHNGDPDPDSTNAYWYLVRAALGTLNLSYETFEDSQADWRDGEILASGLDCP